MVQDKLRIYIDMDGTICDIRKSVEEYRTNHTDKDSTSYKYPWSIPGFFFSLEPLEESIDSVKYLSSKHDVWFLSRPSFRNLDSYTDKARWINKYFGYDFQKKLILSGDKSLLKGDFLIDDHNNANQNKFDGFWIQIFSEKYPGWKSVIDFIEKSTHK